ncbi:MAG: DUF4403 family protein [Holophaga sp.]|nr:DUF4403 family protein [Holophaga sp.]
MHLRPFLLVCSSLPLISSPPPPETTAPSFIAAPVVVDLTQLFATAERLTPKAPPGVETWVNLPGPALGGATFRFNLYRDPLECSFSGNRLVVHTNVNYWLQVGVRMKGWVKGVASCGMAPESYRRARLGMQAEVGLTPDWALDLRVAPEEPQKLDPCQVTALGYDITSKVLASMKDSLLKAARGMEQQLRDSTLLRQKVAGAWLQAQQPVELSPGVHMVLNPQRVRLAPFRSEGNTLTITPEIEIRPSITLGPVPVVAFRPLPPLDLSPTPIQPGFQLRVETELGFEQANAQLAKQMVGQNFVTNKGTFLVESIALRGSEGKLALEVGLKGRVDGKLTLTGRPRFDPASGTIRLDDLDYTMEANSWFTRLGLWLYRGSLRQTLNSKCSLFLDKSFRDLRAQAQAGLNRQLGPGLSMSGTINGFTLDRIQVQDDRLSLLAMLNGQVQIGVKPAL